MITDFQKQNADSAEDDRYLNARRRMVKEIKAMANEACDHESIPISGKVLAVMERVPRHRFVPEEESSSAYYNHPIPIDHGQTLSQPYIVALMTELLALDKQHRVLEIGTGSGYQAAILAEMAGEVFSVEIIKPLARQAVILLDKLGYSSVHLKAGDGNYGWPAYAPFDGIIVTAAANRVPQSLLDQLKPGGRMVIPVGNHPCAQELILITKSHDGTLLQKNVLPVSFVPLTGGH